MLAFRVPSPCPDLGGEDPEASLSCFWAGKREDFGVKSFPQIAESFGRPVENQRKSPLHSALATVVKSLFMPR